MAKNRKTSSQLNNFKRRYKVRGTPPLKLEGKTKQGEIKPIAKTFLKDRPREDTQGTHEVHQVETAEYQALIHRTYEYLKGGVPSNQILQTYMMEDDSMTEARFAKILKYTYTYAENALHKDREYIFQLHMERYEDIFRESMVMEDSWHRPLDPKKDWIPMVRKYQTAIKALRSKEDLLGLHDKSVVLEFNDTQATVIEKQTLEGGVNRVTGYDMEKLSDAELLEVIDLIKKSRTTPLEGIQRVLVKQTRVEVDMNGNRIVEMLSTSIDNVNTTVLQFEEMPAKVVDKFENVVMEDAQVVEPEPNVIDSVPKEYRKLPASNVQNIKEKLRQKTLDGLKEKLKKTE